VRNLILLAGIAVALLASASLWFDEGEAVTLITTDENGNEFETGLWIVELDGVSYPRAESEDAGWVERIRVRPDVQLDRTVAWFRDCSHSLPVRLQSQSPEPPPARSDRTIGLSP
jgi:hypothetical protein